MLDESSPSLRLPPAPAVQIGDVIHSKYKVERVIGEGGMGVVVAAKHLTLDRSVAIKLLSQKSRDSEEALERFMREARAAARIQSEHVGRVLDVDTLANGAPFIVMELLEGHDLSVELRASAKLPIPPAVGIILQACEAIAEAHAAGIVHRDLKPANLFLSKHTTGGERRTVKVLDFGISKITRREESASSTDNKALTNAGAMLGSPLYMSPEQMQASAEVDSRTDIWSLGVILYELVTGRSPFDAKTIPVICAAVLSQPPPPLDLPEAPAGFEKIILRCLEKDPAKRYRDIAHLVRALAPFAPEQAAISLERVMKLRDEQGHPASSPATLPPPPKEGSLTITSWGEKAPVAPKRRWLPLAIAGAGAALIGIIAVSTTLGGKNAATSGESAAGAGSAGPGSAGGREPSPESDASGSARASAPVDVASSQVDGAATADTSASATSAVASPGHPVARPPFRPPPKTSPSAKKPGRTAGFGDRD